MESVHSYLVLFYFLTAQLHLFTSLSDFTNDSFNLFVILRYDDFDVPDTMNVHGVYDTSATMQTFYARREYQTFLQREAGMAGSAFGFYAGVKKAWGSSLTSGSQQYMALFAINIDRWVEKSFSASVQSMALCSKLAGFISTLKQNRCIPK